MEFGEWIRYHRNRKGLTQKSCAIRAGVTQSTWSIYEKGSSERPEYDTVIRIAEALGEPHNAALQAAGYEIPRPLRITEAVEYINGIERPIELTKEKRQQLTEALEKAREYLNTIDTILKC